MPTNKELEAEIAALTKVVTELNKRLPVTQARIVFDPKKLDHYIEHGSPAHAGFLGLVPVKNEEKALADGYYIFKSPSTESVYRLEDQVTPYMQYPDPAQVAQLVLRQKVSELESGKPKIPANTPKMFDPATYMG